MGKIIFVFVGLLVFHFETRADEPWPGDAKAKEVINYFYRKKMIEVSAADSTAFHWETIGGKQLKCDPETGKSFEETTAESCGSGGARNAMTASQVAAVEEMKAKRFLECGGRGLHFSSDPLLSRHYGFHKYKNGDLNYNDCWRLFATDIKQGTRLLNVGGPGSHVKNLKEILGSENCANMLMEGIDTGGALPPEPTEDSRKCIKFKAELFRKLGIDGVRYEWVEYPGTVTELCGSKRKDKSAIILTNPKVLAGSRVYTPKSGGPVEERLAIQNLFTARPYVRDSSQPVDPLWYDDPIKSKLPTLRQGYLATPKQLRPETREWMTQKLTNCQINEPFVPVNEQGSQVAPLTDAERRSQE